MWAGGWIVDRYNPKALLLGAMVAASVLSLVSPLLVDIGYYALLISRVGLGMSEVSVEIVILSMTWIACRLSFGLA